MLIFHFFKNLRFRLKIAILTLPRASKRFLVLAVDLCLCILSVWLSYYLRLGEFVPLSGDALWPVAVSIALALPIFVASGLYRAIFRYSGLPALISVVRAVGIYGMLYISVFTAIGVEGVPRTLGAIQPILLLLFVGLSRVLAKVWLGNQYQSTLKQTLHSRVLIYGAGSAGRELVAAIANSHKMKAVGFLDDDYRLQGQLLNGQPIFNPADLANLVKSLNINDVLLAIPSLSRKRRNEILAQIRAVHVSVRTLPSMTDMAQGKISISELHELDIDDLLGREPIVPNHNLLGINLRGKVVMVTGAGGSIGSELCRQIFFEGPSKLLLIEQSEFSLYCIHQELEAKSASGEIKLIPLLVSVQDNERMRQIISIWHPDTIYHAAAYKHVPLVEQNSAEGIKNNLFGTLFTAQSAGENGVSNFVLISTDKAVRPTNIMGASKRLAEMVLQALDVTYSRTKFSIVRFGNVLGSSGSVVPKFRQQISDGGPITLTHPEITRFFMTIPEAAQLVIQAGAMAKGGDVFVLDMGQPVKIMNLARSLIELSGRSVRDAQNPDGEIEIEITGLRPGEKLYEELLIGSDSQSTEHPRILRAKEEFISWGELEHKLKSLEIALSINDVSFVRQMLQQLVTGYLPSEKVVDWVYREQEENILDP